VSEREGREGREGRAGRGNKVKYVNVKRGKKGKSEKSGKREQREKEGAQSSGWIQEVWKEKKKDSEGGRPEIFFKHPYGLFPPSFRAALRQ
jgi:hypothetical protein